MGKSEIIAITGPMFAGKTTMLINMYREIKSKGATVEVFKPSKDSRSSHNYITSHLGEQIRASNIRELRDISIVCKKQIDYALFDEAQFYECGFWRVVLALSENGTTCIVAGLKCTSSQQPFGDMPKILAIADKIHLLEAVCAVSGEPATRTYCKVKKDSDILIGGEQVYEPRNYKFHSY